MRVKSYITDYHQPSKRYVGLTDFIIYYHIILSSYNHLHRRHHHYYNHYHDRLSSYPNSKEEGSRLWEMDVQSISVKLKAIREVKMKIKQNEMIR